MYLTRLSVKGLKRIRSLELDFAPDGAPRMWTVIIGENGTAKTSLLQAVALASVGSAQVNRLGREGIALLRDRRHEDPLHLDAVFQSRNGRIESHLELEKGETTLRASDSLEGRPALDGIRSRTEPGFFVAAYGVGRFLPRPSESPGLVQPAVERMEPLFANDVALTSLRFADHFDDERALFFARQLNSLLRDAALLPGIEGIELRGRGGVKSAGDLMERDRIVQRLGASGDGVQKLPALALAHGHQSTLAWLADLYGHYLLEEGDEVVPSDVRGLVLIDELDLDLHPSWQRGLVTRLRACFPQVQFIVTTHSPAVVANVGPSEVVRLQIDEATGDVALGSWDAERGGWRAGQSASQTDGPDARVMTGSEILQSYFGLPQPTPNEEGRDLKRLYVLATDPFRTDEEDAEAQRIHQELSSRGVHKLPDLSDRRAFPRASD